ncbi:hypothetical protein OE88DRAFT_1184463 [Heliocybe sulcata]|uniref:Protein kinase domain-containing protein n=1 Tax=Heliocybe sulcata TaxID=5364 RepID=A0A5C3NAG0_9AGAM|nr:hypothetical protein OE88DRAFT_1184463 [Heliocybe sulcata]
MIWTKWINTRLHAPSASSGVYSRPRIRGQALWFPSQILLSCVLYRPVLARRQLSDHSNARFVSLPKSRSLAPVSCTSSSTKGLLLAHVSELGRFPFAGGGFSDVYEAKLSNNGTLNKVVVKIFRPLKVGYPGVPEEPEKLRRRLLREVAVWHRVNHPNVLPFLGLKYGVGRPEYCQTIPGLVSPYCENQTVTAYMDIRIQEGADPAGLRSVMVCIYGWSYSTTTVMKASQVTGITQGLHYLHDVADVVHGDLKPLRH